MAWIESHQELGRHPKLLRLAKQLDISCPTAVGHLHYLWWWALDYAQNGRLDRLGSAEVASAAEWEGDPGAFMEALIKSGFLDEDQSIHDWHDYAGRLIIRREANKQRMRHIRALHVSHTLTHVLSDRTQPYPTGPNRTGPNHGGGAIAQPPEKKKVKSKELVKTISQEFRAKMVERWGAILGADTIQERIAEALNHTAVKKAMEIEPYVNGWLRRDADKLATGGQNGRKPETPRYSPARSEVDDALGKY